MVPIAASISSLAIGLLAGAPAWGVEPAQTNGVVRLASSASAEVAKDLLGITFGTTREGPDAAGVQAQLKQALDAALAEARKAARPGQVDVQIGSFTVSPRYTAKGAINGWQGSAELLVEGRDMQAIGSLSGRITTLSIARVGYSLSRDAREKAEAEVSGQAIAAYRSKADTCARQFGYTGYVVREIEITSSEPLAPRPMLAMRSKALSSDSDDALPVEAGKAVVTVSVSGAVQLTR